MNVRKTRVAVVFGGRSSEHAISCVSAASVLANLDPERFEVIGVGIRQDGSWVLGTNDPAQLEIRDRRLPSVAEGTDLALTGGELVSVDSANAGAVLGTVDVMFPVLHGAFGEDGTIQGLFEMAGVPYAGAGVLASSVAMDKDYSKKLLAADGLPVGEYVVLRRGQDSVDVEHLGLPLFVKPARAGSSTGITRVTALDQLPAAIATAREIDPKVIIEAAVVGSEVECGVLEFPDGSVRASLPAGIQMLDGEGWYDFESKYLDTDASCAIDIPAKLDDTVIAAVQEQAVRAFHALDCQGLARVDFFITPEGQPVINEVNTMPGFTSTSAYPKMWAVTGVDYPTLLTTMIETAIARGTGLR